MSGPRATIARNAVRESESESLSVAGGGAKRGVQSPERWWSGRTGASRAKATGWIGMKQVVASGGGE